MKFLVVDDHAIVREGMRHALESLGDNVTVLEARNAHEALALVAQHPDIDLALLDLGLPGTDGFETLRRVRQQNATVPVIILSALDDSSRVMAAFNMGAAGFISKSSDRNITLQAVRLVLAGGVYIPMQALAYFDGTKDTPQPGSDTQARSLQELGLTERQAQVLALIARGKPNKIIASELNIAEPTVKAHVTEILRALKVTNRSQALIAARRLGFK